MSLSIVIPCYNEELNISRYAVELWPVLESLGVDFEVIIVDDGSTDKTVAEVQKIGKPHVRLVGHDVNKGLGAALRTGIAAATGDWLIFLDGDLTFHPALIPRLLRALREHPQADFVIGSPSLARYDERIPRWRIFISKAANFVYSVFLGQPITSVNQIFRLYKTRDLKELNLESSGFEINAEILFKLVFRGKKFVEIPAELTARQYGVSKLDYAKEIPRHFFLLVRILRWRFL